MKYVESLPSIPVDVAPEKHYIFTSDDFSDHFLPKVEKDFRKKDHYLIRIGGRITADIQVNDTSYHRQAKAAFGNHEVKPMTEKVEKDHPIKILTPTRLQMQIIQESCKQICANVHKELFSKTNMITLALDGSEDHLVSEKFMDLIRKEMLGFREQLLTSKPAVTLSLLRMGLF